MNMCTQSELYGYVRVSTREQNEERQLIALHQFQIPQENIFIDKQSGKDFDRPAYMLLMDSIKENDLIVIKSIDRLGRDYEEIMEQWRIITREKKADIKIIDMPLLDTTQCKDLLGTFISDLVLQVLSFVSENERQSIRQRQREGIDAALARGVRFGRPKKEADDLEETVRLYRAKKIPLQEALIRSGLSKTTFYSRLKEYA